MQRDRVCPWPGSLPAAARIVNRKRVLTRMALPIVVVELRASEGGRATQRISPGYTSNRQPAAISGGAHSQYRRWCMPKKRDRSTGGDGLVRSASEQFGTSLRPRLGQ